MEFAVILSPLSERSMRLEENMLSELSQGSKSLPLADTVKVTLCNSILIAIICTFFHRIIIIIIIGNGRN